MFPVLCSLLRLETPLKSEIGKFRPSALARPTARFATTGVVPNMALRCLQRNRGYAYFVGRRRDVSVCSVVWDSVCPFLVASPALLFFLMWVFGVCVLPRFYH